MWREHEYQVQFEALEPLSAARGTRGERIRSLTRALSAMWTKLEYGYATRMSFMASTAELHDVDKEKKLQAEVDKLGNKILPMVEREMAMVSRREEVKHKLALLQQEAAHTHRKPSEMNSLANELRRITFQISVTLSAWVKTHDQPFLYRGMDYIDFMEVEREYEVMSNAGSHTFGGGGPLQI
eukprot:GFYU01037300.1.p1 GENE.GFYU01037300.1~~GFYU01037300.1.p1  ORF type:complete len:183 (+),score=37.26 GFYU01037300.1:3-551(+)